ncbi:MAG: aminopeptidase P family N-terminal domain-containing protein, partial [Blastomonas fulva]|uniref:aminopeptidase P family N-terminal domain-containing protein n=1 Tax=Blastomonas fulva TaxID=1550728 RepID=UPI0040340368
MTMLTRRDTLASSLALPLGLATGMGAAPSAQAQAAGASPRPPDLSFLKTDPLVNADRLRWEMETAGVDAILAMQPANVFYLSNHWPQLDRMGMRGAGVVVFPRDPAIPMALIMHAFLYYYTHTPESAFTDRAVYT